MADVGAPISGGAGVRRTPGVVLGLAVGTWITALLAGAVLLYIAINRDEIGSLDGFGYAMMFLMAASSAAVCGAATALATAAHLLVHGWPGMPARSWLLVLPAMAAPVAFFLYFQLA